MTTATLSCGHVLRDCSDDTELRDRLRCPECFDDGVLYVRYVMAVRP